MEIIDNINQLLGDNLKQTLTPGARLKIAASCFSIYAFEALKAELEGIEFLEFIFTTPTFVPGEATNKVKKERREFHIPRLERERGFYGSEFEIRLRNKLTQRAIARECAAWIRRKAAFRSNQGSAPMQQFACVSAVASDAVYMPIHGFTAVDLGYQTGNAVSSMVNRMDEPPITSSWIHLFDQIWNDKSKLEDVTERLCEHIASVYQENSPERIYFLVLYNIFNDFLEDISADVLPNDLGYQNSLIWQKLYNFQRDAATGIINKLETYSGCILADSVGLGKTFTALAVIKCYELRNRTVLVLCPKKLADNWLNYNRNLKTNIFAKDRFSYDVLCHTDLQRTRGYSFGMPLNRINWGNYDLVVIDESHNFRNQRCLQGQGKPLPKADELGHQSGCQDQSADALSHAGQQPFQRFAKPTCPRVRGRSGKPQCETEDRKRHQRYLPQSAGSLQHLVCAAAGGAHSRRDSQRPGFRLLRVAGFRHHRAIAEAY